MSISTTVTCDACGASATTRNKAKGPRFWTVTLSPKQIAGLHTTILSHAHELCYDCTRRCLAAYLTELHRQP
jgi:hypothetical protein